MVEKEFGGKEVWLWLPEVHEPRHGGERHWPWLSPAGAPLTNAEVLASGAAQRHHRPMAAVEVPRGGGAPRRWRLVVVVPRGGGRQAAGLRRETITGKNHGKQSLSPPCGGSVYYGGLMWKWKNQRRPRTRRSHLRFIIWYGDHRHRALHGYCNVQSLVAMGLGQQRWTVTQETTRSLLCGHRVSVWCVVASGYIPRLSKGWVSNKWLPVSHLLHSIWPSSLSTCFTGGPLSSVEENREVKEQQDKWRNVKRGRYLTSSRGRRGGVWWPVGRQWLVQLPLLDVMMMMSLEHSQLISNTDGKMQHK